MSTWLGWIGAVLVLGAYGLVSFAVVKPESRLWAFMNITGAAALAVSAGLVRRWPFVVLNAVWFLIGISSLLRPPKARAGTA